MEKYVDIFCLNKQHSTVICDFLNDLQGIIDDATYYDEDLMGFYAVMKDCLDYHNGLGLEVIKNDVAYKNWYYSLANNIYWTTKGYFASLEDKKSVAIYEEKVIYLIRDFLDRLDLALIIDPGTVTEGKIHLN